MTTNTINVDAINAIAVPAATVATVAPIDNIPTVPTNPTDPTAPTDPINPTNPTVPTVPIIAQSNKRGTNFSELEQKNLTEAWLEVSLDPIHGNDQRGTDFYKKVGDVFQEKMGTLYTFRSNESLHAHWRDTIQCNVSKFSSAYSKATSKVHSGYTPDDYIRDAQMLFMSDNKTKKPFKLMHCWDILKNHSKWCPSRNNSPSEGLPHIGPMLDQPIGCNTAKKARIEAKSKDKVVNGTKESQLKQVIDLLGDNHRERKDIALKNYTLIEKRSALKELQIFQTDTSDEGKLIARQLRAQYIKKYLSEEALANTTEPILDQPIAATTPQMYSTPVGVPGVSVVGMVDLTPLGNEQVPQVLEYVESTVNIEEI
jgi:hypothetical protein